MKPIRSVCLLVVAAWMLALTGCFDYTEETKFDETGAGKLSIVFNLGDLSGTEKLAAAILKKNPINKDDMQKDLPEGVKLIEYREETKNEQKTIYATYEFKDANKFKDWQTQKDRFSGLSLNKVGDVWAYSRTVKAKNKEDLDNAKKQFSRSKIVVKLTGPGKLIKEESNPTRDENETTMAGAGSASSPGAAEPCGSGPRTVPSTRGLLFAEC